MLKETHLHRLLIPKIYLLIRPVTPREIVTFHFAGAHHRAKEEFALAVFTTLIRSKFIDLYIYIF
jgi:hypothetical protein